MAGGTATYVGLAGQVADDRGNRVPTAGPATADAVLGAIRQTRKELGLSAE